MPFILANMIGERRCECSTKQPGVEGHYNGNMLDPAYARKPRDLTHHRDVVSATEATDGIADAAQIAAPLGLHPYHTAFSLVPTFHQYLQVVYDSLHALDGGGTMRHLLFLGNWLYKTGGDARLALANKRLAAMPRHDDFTHFSRVLWALDSKGDSTRTVKFAANWRCTEYEQLVSQMMCVSCWRT